MVKKANNTRAFLQRNIYQCPRKTKELFYKTLVRPRIWDPHNASHTHSLEMVQRRAARFVTGNFYRTSSVNNMLHISCDGLPYRREELKVPNSQQSCCHTNSMPYTHCSNSKRSQPPIPLTICKDGYLPTFVLSRHHQIMEQFAIFHPGLQLDQHLQERVAEQQIEINSHHSVFNCIAISVFTYTCCT